MLKSNKVNKYIIFLLFFVVGSLHAQSTSLIDLASPLYHDLENWEQLGYVESLPPLRPYSHFTIINRLGNLLGRENIPDDIREKAREHLAAISKSNPRMTLGLGATGYITDKESNFKLNASPGFRWLVNNTESTSIWAEFTHSMNFLNLENETILPLGRRELSDGIVDDSSFDVFNQTIEIVQFTQSILSFSSLNKTENGIFNFSIGNHRSSIGPFHDDGVIMSSQTPAAGQIILGYEHQFETQNGFTPRLFYQSQFSMLSATDNNGENNYNKKYLMYHGLYGSILPWLELGFIEAVVWGDRLELFYFIPLSSLFTSQGLVGFSDNSFIGLEAMFRPLPNLQIPLVLFMDDIHFNDIVRFNLNTKYKLAGQIGVIWTSLLPIVDRLFFDYTAVMPYMYTHVGEDSSNSNGKDMENPNYNNYTHQGTNIGPSLEPNSDRWRLDWRARPLRNINTPDWFTDLQIGSRIQFIRHGNASKGIINGGTGDIFDPGYNGGQPTFQPPYVDPTNQPYTRFLTQDIIEHNLQFSIEAYGTIMIANIIQLNLGLEYIHEQIWNAELVAGARNHGNYVRIYLGLSD